MRRGRWLLCLAALSLGGCTTFVARQIERPGHAGGSFRTLDGMLLKMGFARETAQLPDDVGMAYWIAPPRAYQIKESFQSQPNGKHGKFSFTMSFGDGPLKPGPVAIKGSIVLLHPWGMSGTAMMPWGLYFAAAGYKVVMPDLRSQGDSSQAPVGYGPREAGDIVELVRELQAKHRLPGPLYLLGASYGATVALFAAPRLPGLRGVMALEPYANAADVIRRAPGSGLFGYKWLVRWITPEEINAAIARASRKLGVDLEHVNPGDALARTSNCTLILRGSRDVLVSGEALTALSRRSARASHVEVPGEGHLTLPVRAGRLVPPLLAWMQALPDTDGPCPIFSPPPVPPAVPSQTSASAPAEVQSR